MAQLLAVIVLSSAVVVLSKRALREVPAFTFVWLQIAIGGGLLTALTFGIRGERIPRRLGRSPWVHVALIGLCGITAVRVLFMLALARLPATTHAYLVNFTGIATMLLSVVMLGERPGPMAWIGAGMALLGLHAFFGELPAGAELVGTLQVATGVLALAVANNLVRRLWRIGDGRLGSHVMSTVSLWIGGGPVVLAGLLFDWPPRVPDLATLGIITAAAIVSLVIGATVFAHVLRTLRSYEASLVAGSGVIWTALLAMPILGERLTPREIVGIAAMLAGVVLVQFRRERRSGPG
jgi:drug/metabolite transporter (DMT)-like permease